MKMIVMMTTTVMTMMINYNTYIEAKKQKI